jgi:hypothetical protein
VMGRSGGRHDRLPPIFATQHHAELLAPIAGRNVGVLADAAGQCSGYLAQAGIAGTINLALTGPMHRALCSIAPGRRPNSDRTFHHAK